MFLPGSQLSAPKICLSHNNVSLILDQQSEEKGCDLSDFHLHDMLVHIDSMCWSCCNADKTACLASGWTCIAPVCPMLTLTGWWGPRLWVVSPCQWVPGRVPGRVPTVEPRKASRWPVCLVPFFHRERKPPWFCRAVTHYVDQMAHNWES